MSMEHKIREAIEKSLSPQRLEVVNDSDRHLGHAGHDGSGESHFSVMVVSDLFKGKSRLERHRMVHAILSGGTFSTIHALSVKALAPDEGGGGG